MKNTDFILLKAQFDALRIWAITRNLDNISSQDRWMSKYTLWRLERENLSSHKTTHTSSPETLDKIHQREYELQLLLDTAYYHGNLQEYEITRYIDNVTLERISKTNPDDFDEETILRNLKELL